MAAAASSSSSAASPSPLSVTDYYDVKFVSAPENLECAVCTSTAFDPPNLACGHLFCRKCLTSCHPRHCPTCRVPFAISKLPSIAFVRQQIWNLRVKCSVDPEECPWSDALGIEDRNLKAHHLVCTYRKAPCEWCKQDVAIVKMNEHKLECPSRPVVCPHCTRKLGADKLLAHLSRGGAVGPCEYTRRCPFGCVDHSGQILVVRAFMLDEHEAVCPRRPLSCPVCSPTHRLAADAMREHLRLEIARQPAVVVQLLLATSKPPWNQVMTAEELEQSVALRSGLSAAFSAAVTAATPTARTWVTAPLAARLQSSSLSSSSAAAAAATSTVSPSSFRRPVIPEPQLTPPPARVQSSAVCPPVLSLAAPPAPMMCMNEPSGDRNAGAAAASTSHKRGREEEESKQQSAGSGSADSKKARLPRVPPPPVEVDATGVWTLAALLDLIKHNFKLRHSNPLTLRMFMPMGSDHVAPAEEGQRALVAELEAFLKSNQIDGRKINVTHARLGPDPCMLSLILESVFIL